MEIELFLMEFIIFNQCGNFILGIVHAGINYSFLLVPKADLLNLHLLGAWLHSPCPELGWGLSLRIFGKANKFLKSEMLM